MKIQRAQTSSYQQFDPTSQDQALEYIKQNHSRNGYSKQLKLATLLLLTFSMIQGASATTNNTNNNATSTSTSSEARKKQIANLIKDMPDVASNYFDPTAKMDAQTAYGNGKVRVYIDSIEPEGGPTVGNTRVLVRGEPLEGLESIYPHPKCRFGKNDMVVDATYVLCTESPTRTEQ